MSINYFFTIILPTDEDDLKLKYFHYNIVVSIKNLIFNITLINNEIMGKLICSYGIRKEDKISRIYIFFCMFHFGKWQQRVTHHNIAEILLKLALKPNQSINKRQRKVNTTQKENSC